MSENKKLLHQRLAISYDQINQSALTQLVVDAFLYHEGMTSFSLGEIGHKDALCDDGTERIELWDAFETNSTVSAAMRDIILKAAGQKE